MPGFHVENFGCRAARADGEAIAARLASAGHSENRPADAEVVIVNTCSVTAEADRAVRAFIRRAHRLNPSARILVTGCYAQRAPQELAVIPGVSAVIGNSHKALAPKIALDLIAIPGSPTRPPIPADLIQIKTAPVVSAARILADDTFAHSFLEESQVVPGAQTRPNLKIQEGCGNRCSFCVIPQTRGHSRSLPTESILRQVEGFVAAGGNELVFSGINLGRWGRDLPGMPALAHLVQEILAKTALPRLRLSSIEPMDWTPELIALMARYGGQRLARHAHLPLQSGSDSVLRRMHRRYRPWHYVQKVEQLLAAAGTGLTLGADVMAGFPGETDAEFDETMDMVRKLPFAYLHIFPFSPRPGTRGWALHAEQPVPGRIVEERITALRTLALEKSKNHRKSFVGRELEAITLHTSAEVAAGCSSALTENFLPVELDARLPANQLVRVCVTALTADGTLRAAPAGLQRPGR